MRKCIPRLVLCLAVSLLVLPVFAQDAGPYVIKSLDFSVKGRTLSFVLRQLLEQDGPVVGRSFDSLDKLQAFIADKRQVILNQRVIASAESSYELEADPAGGQDVAIRFDVVDTWNIIALPEPKYDSNTGLTLYIKGRDYNFAGSMQTLDLDLSYVSDTASNKSLELSTSFDLPFQALGAEWSLGLAEDFQYWTADQVFRSGSTASLTWNIGGLGFPAHLGLSQGFNYNADFPPAADAASDPYFLVESASLGASIPTGVDLGGPLGLISYSPSMSLTYNWWPTTTLLVAGREGTSLTFSNVMSSGRSDWIGNTRHGITATLISTQTFSFSSNALTWDLSASLGGYWAWLDNRLGLAARFTLLDRPEGDVQNLGGYLRGVLDARAPGMAIAAVNVSIPIKLFDFPTHAIIKVDWLDFELQTQPFVDAAAIVPSWSALPSKSWIWASGGLEFLVFPVRMRTFIVRASIGWDLRAVLASRSLTAPTSDGSKPYEIYFGTGLAY